MCAAEGHPSHVATESDTVLPGKVRPRRSRSLADLSRQLGVRVSKLLSAKAASRFRSLRNFLPQHGRAVLGVGILFPLIFTFISVMIIRSPPALPAIDEAARLDRRQDFLPPTDVDNSQLLESSLKQSLSSGAIVDALRRSFYIPRVVSSVLPDPMKYEILTRLQDQTQDTSKHVFFLHVVGDNSTNRLAAVATSLSYTRLMNRMLVVLWDVSRGGEGTSPYPPLTMRSAMKKENVFFHTVNDLSLLIDEREHTHLHVNYWSDRVSQLRYFDNVAAIKTRHVFIRASHALSGKYIQPTSGIERLSQLFVPSPNLYQTFLDYVSPWTFPHLTPDEVTDQLHRSYSVPRAFLTGMTDTNQRRLLHNLDKSSSKRCFFLHAQFGLGNRLRALGSAMAVAKVTGRVLVLIWVPDIHLNCKFSDLFVNDLVVMSKFSMEWPPSAMHSNDHALTTVDFYNFMRHEGNKQVHNSQTVNVDPRSGRHVYAKTAYVVKSTFTPRIVSYTSDYWNTMRETLVPSADILEIVEHPDLMKVKYMVGVHIRSRRIENDIKGVGQEFYGKGSTTTDYWRKRTSYQTFADKISSLNAQYRYFVAADTPEAVRMLREQFGLHRIYSISREADCVTRSVDCAKLALADILLLSKTRVLLGSHWSSFSEGAVRMSGKKLRVIYAGLHFGRFGKQATKKK